MAFVKLDNQPSRSDLNWFAVIWLVFFSLLGALAFFWWQSPTTATVLWVLAGVVPIVGSLVPTFLLLVYVGLMTLVFPIGWTVSHILMGTIYYLVATPIALVLRAIGRDPLEKVVDTSAPSYWTPRKQQTDPTSYFRQF